LLLTMQHYTKVTGAGTSNWLLFPLLFPAIATLMGSGTKVVVNSAFSVPLIIWAIVTGFPGTRKTKALSFARTILEHVASLVNRARRLVMSDTQGDAESPTKDKKPKPPPLLVLVDKNGELHSARGACTHACMHALRTRSGLCAF